MRSISEIRSLSPERAAEGLPVEVEGQVVNVHARYYGLFIHDGQNGIYIERAQTILFSGVAFGDVVRITGTTVKGGFMPGISARNFEVLSKQPLLKSRPFRPGDFFKPALDCEWVSVEGRVIEQKVVEYYESIVVKLEVFDSVIDVQIPYSESALRKIASLMFKRVVFDAVVGTSYNDERQMIGRVFFAASADQLRVVEEEVPSEDIETVPIHELLRVDSDTGTQIRTQGTVTYAEGNQLFLRGEKANLKVVTAVPANVEIGDYVELTGFAWPRPISPAFRARKVHVIMKNKEPVPVRPVFVTDTSSPQWSVEGREIDAALNYELVELDAELLDIGKSFVILQGAPEGGEQVTLRCRKNEHFFEATLPPGVELDAGIKAGAVLRLTGICQLIQHPQIGWRLYIDGFRLQLRGADSVKVLVPTPWLTQKKLAWISEIMAGILFLFLIWVVALRKLVDKQTRIIGKQVKRESILSERQRIARELHDNLEQGLAGMAIQLRGCKKLMEINTAKSLASIRQTRSLAENASNEIKEQLDSHFSEVENDAVKSRTAIEVVQGMLAHCSEESRSSILDLRGGLLEKMDLIPAIETALHPLVDGTEIRLEVQVRGAARKLKQIAERNLLLIVKEAATNAVRHSGPSRIQVEVAYAPDRLMIQISDDGCGFDPEQLPPSGRFGLRGMHERVNQLKGTICFESKKGEGTEVRIELPSTQEWELGHNGG